MSNKSCRTCKLWRIGSMRSENYRETMRPTLQVLQTAQTMHLDNPASCGVVSRENEKDGKNTAEEHNQDKKKGTIARIRTAQTRVKEKAQICKQKIKCTEKIETQDL